MYKSEVLNHLLSVCQSSLGYGGREILDPHLVLLQSTTLIYFLLKLNSGLCFWWSTENELNLLHAWEMFSSGDRCQMEQEVRRNPFKKDNRIKQRTNPSALQPIINQRLELGFKLLTFI